VSGDGLRAELITILHKEQPTTDGLYRHECVDIVDTLMPAIRKRLDDARKAQQ
jgi:hypothetical protein